MDRLVLNRYIRALLIIKSSNFDISDNLEKQITKLIQVEVENADEFWFPLCCYIDESARKHNKDSYLVAKKYKLNNYGEKFYSKYVSIYKNKKLKLLFELVYCFGFEGKQQGSSLIMSNKTIKRYMNLSRAVCMCVRAMKIFIMLSSVLLFIYTQYYLTRI